MPEPSDQQRKACVLLGLYNIIGNPKASPPIQALLPICRTSWLNGVKEGKYPKPIKHGRRTFWRQSDIIDLLDQLGGAQ